MQTYEELYKFIEQLTIIDTHEHLPLKEELRDMDADVLTEYLSHYISTDLISAGTFSGRLPARYGYHAAHFGALGNSGALLGLCAVHGICARVKNRRAGPVRHRSHRAQYNRRDQPAVPRLHLPRKIS